LNILRVSVVASDYTKNVSSEKIALTGSGNTNIPRLAEEEGTTKGLSSSGFVTKGLRAGEGLRNQRKMGVCRGKAKAGPQRLKDDIGFADRENDCDLSQ
jgi:hypothetical protein